jgi:hypothetical protein
MRSAIKTCPCPSLAPALVAKGRGFATRPDDLSYNGLGGEDEGIISRDLRRPLSGATDRPRHRQSFAPDLCSEKAERFQRADFAAPLMIFATGLFVGGADLAVEPSEVFRQGCVIR